MALPRICFLALKVYPLLSADDPQMAAGGAEVQQRLIANYLVQQGYPVSLIAGDYGQPERTEVNGIVVHKAYQRERGLRFVRYVHPRGTGIWQALRRADADVYYQRCAGMGTGLLGAFCRYHGKKFVFAAASNTDFDPNNVIVPRRMERHFYFWGLRHADAIVAQTETQRALLRKNFDRDALVITNSFVEKISNPRRCDRSDYVLWVGTFNSLKRPQVFVDIAEGLPNIRFVMAGGAGGGWAADYEELAKRAGGLANITLEGRVAFNDMGRVYDGARIVVNTSEPKEGFPNTFLHAWSRGVPVVSFFDPDGLIKRYRLGIPVSSVGEMCSAIESLMNDTNLYQELQKNVVAYRSTNHQISQIGPRYETLFKTLAEQG